MDLPKCGSVQEISNALSTNQGSIKVTGRLIQHDCINRQATLCDPQTSASLCVDTSLTEPLEGSVGSLFQVIGEVEREDGGDTPIVRARIMRCVDGMDLLMYNRALRNQQKYFQSRNVTLVRHN
ncbi:CST complex subunit TEN1-like [Crassostrea angulata]|uniref:CST complex subunit TEN1 n=1 Tax=Magallana gigas TaxID=29159 RepID=A0A8W8L4C0_MAGGI|nr:CST complex subunit TEN1-like [Crassostrea gigas]XP_052672692.1 CST complex subunit TEN1-like [Crassostrea angulata]|eukprot:XP_011446596.1 PREDICTED: CST complex subunit TEN1-like isoform X1 [Crassostrea gigas]